VVVVLLDGELPMVEQVDLDQVQQDKVGIILDQVRVVRDIMVEQVWVLVTIPKVVEVVQED
jgi:hypothetical protein